MVKSLQYQSRRKGFPFGDVDRAKLDVHMRTIMDASEMITFLSIRPAKSASLARMIGKRIPLCAPR